MPRCTIRGCPVTQSYWRLQVGKTPSFEVLLKPAASYLEAITTTAQVTSNAADVVLSKPVSLEKFQKVLKLTQEISEPRASIREMGDS